MKKLIITCPYCDNEFSSDGALRKHLVSRFQKEIEIQEKLLENKYKLKLQLEEKKLKNKFSESNKEKSIWHF